MRPRPFSAARSAAAIALAFFALVGSAYGAPIPGAPAAASTARIARIETAVNAQLRAVGRDYSIHPFSWAAVHVVPDNEIEGYCGGVPSMGCNDGNEAWVSNFAGQLSVTISHEVIEMATGRQICDPVETKSYVVDGVRVSQWVRPRRLWAARWLPRSW